MSFEEKLKDLRVKNGISQKKLAESIGVAQSSITYWENGQRTPSIEAAQKIADYFGVTVSHLLLDENNLRKYDIPEGMVQIGEGENSFSVNPIEFFEKFNNVAKRVHPSNVSTLLSDFFTLNAKGQNEAVRQTKLLTKIPEYQKERAQPILNAAHERTDIEVTDEMRKHDDAIMEDDAEWE